MVERRHATVQEARALAHPIRVRMLRLLYDEELTNRELAQRLDLDPATSLHHVRTLVRAGYLEPLAERRGARGARERPYRSTGKSWRLDYDDTGVPLASAMLDAFVAEVAECDGRDVAMVRMALRLTEARRAELTQRLEALLEDYADPDEEATEPWAVFVALHPRFRPPA